MGKFSKIMIVVVLLFFLPGSAAPTFAPSLKVVDRVEVACRQGKVCQQRRYTSPAKISSVLNYLRMCRSLGRANTDPERLAGDSYTIRVFLSDGTGHIYHQRADRYLSRDYRPWQTIDPAWACGLYYLLQTMPSDPPRCGNFLQNFSAPYGQHRFFMVY